MIDYNSPDYRARVIAHREQERTKTIKGGAALFLILLLWLGWLAGTAIIALALTFIVPHFAYWQAFIIVFAVFISGKRVVGWFKRGEVR